LNYIAFFLQKKLQKSGESASLGSDEPMLIGNHEPPSTEQDALQPKEHLSVAASASTDFKELKLGAEKNTPPTGPDPTQHLEKLPEVVSYMHSSNHSSCVIANFYLFCIVCTFAEW
jgi:hypothetical protein